MRNIKVLGMQLVKQLNQVCLNDVPKALIELCGKAIRTRRLVVFHLKHSTALMFSRQNGILYSEEGFTVGNKETFDRFIRDKCPDARFH